MVISCTFCLFVAFEFLVCRSLVSGLFLASKMNSCGCHDMMLNLSQSERKRDDRRLSQWAAAYLHIWHKYFYGPRLKTNTLLWSWSRASQSTEGCLLKRPSAKLIPPFISPYLFFCFPNIAKWHQSELRFSGELISWNAQAGDAENGNLFPRRRLG